MAGRRNSVFEEHTATDDLLWFPLSFCSALPISLKVKIGSHSKSVFTNKNPLKVNSIHVIEGGILSIKTMEVN